MEATCHRCHQPVQAEDCFCPSCGLPQLVYTAETEGGQVQAERWRGVIRDTNVVDWKPAMRASLALAVPAGILSSGVSPVGIFGIFWIAGAALWAVAIYVRAQRPAWITTGAGARIGLVTGLFACWLAFSISGTNLFVNRIVLHHGTQMDKDWKSRVNESQQMTQNWSMGLSSADTAQAQSARAQVQAWMLSPWGHAGIEAFSFACNSIFLLFFAAGGGALGARLLARSRRQPDA
ncbi:MAG TPA: zinc ribbon domain-containing protein [Terracidiphilus sp.]|nr:zinc ribbon domain-containing protein [Terracidiphilus sp.]